MDFFKIMQLEKQYDIDLNQLTRQYLVLQAKYHPDRAISESEKTSFLHLSSDLNKAYGVLKDHLLRAQHLLALKGYEFDEKNKVQILSKSELEDIFNDFSLLAEIDALDSLKQMHNDKKAQQQEYISSLAEHFANKKYNDALAITVRLKYLNNLIENINNKISKCT